MTDFLRILERQVARSPGRIAISEGVRDCSFQQLEKLVNKVAHELKKRGVVRGSLVGLALPRSTEYIISALAVLKASAAFLPLPLDAPPKYVSRLIKKVKLAHLIANSHDKRLESVLSAGTGILEWEELQTCSANQCSDPPKRNLTLDDPAYAMFTSGSTGDPKCVLAPYRGLWNRCSWMWRAFPFSSDDVLACKTPVTFVDSLWELFGGVFQGVRTVIIDEASVRDPELLSLEMESYRVTRATFVPSMLGDLLSNSQVIGARLRGFKLCIVSGEPLASALCQKFFQCLPSTRLLNLYGCTELAGDVTAQEINPIINGGVIPIGAPLPKTNLFIVNDDLRICDGEQTGELLVGGRNLAIGYIEDEALNARSFHWFQISKDRRCRVFRTGDLARHEKDGSLIFVGRKDRQIKVNGMRLDPASVEQELLHHESISEAAMVQYVDSSGDYTAAFVRGNIRNSKMKDLRKFLLERVPSWHAPQFFFKVAKMPLLRNGKIDYLKLRTRLGKNINTHKGASVSAEDDALLHELCHLASEILRVPISPKDSFMELGGDSVKAVRVVARLRNKFKINVPVELLFECKNFFAFSESFRKLLQGSEK